MRQARSESFPVSGWGFICPSSATGLSRRLTNSAALLTAMGGCPLPTRILPAALLRKFTAREVHREMEAQIARVLHAGIRPTHLDSHQHVHLMPGVFDITLDLAEAYKIRVVRLSRDRAVFSPALASWPRSPAWGPGFPERPRQKQDSHARIAVRGIFSRPG